MTEPLLESKAIVKRFGGLTACDRIDLRIDDGEFVALIGPNGAGKTTFFNVLAGALDADEGAVYLDGRDITNFAPHRRARLGLARTFQIPKPFERMTVKDNLMVVGGGHPGEGMVGSLFGLGHQAEQERATRADEILDFLMLSHLDEHYAGELSGGQRKLLELGRALMLEPQVLLLDEPLAGVNPTLGATIMDRLKELNRDGMTLVMVEHDVETVLRECPRIVVLVQGSVLVDGTAQEVRSDERVLEAYLGGGHFLDSDDAGGEGVA